MKHQVASKFLVKGTVKKREKVRLRCGEHVHLAKRQYNKPPMKGGSGRTTSNL